jgi:uncharacterized cofD-like protein
MADPGGRSPVTSRREWRVERDAWLLNRRPLQLVRRPLRVVALGGGTGLPTVLRGLKLGLSPMRVERAYPAEVGQLSAIVTVADDGGSSGRLREEHGVLPPGDVRNCLLALSDGDPLMARLFEYRFDGVGATGGHSLGNLILTALALMGERFDKAVEESGRLLTVRGAVFPSTLQPVRLRAELADGTFQEGESRIARAGHPIVRVLLEPPDVPALPPAVAAIEDADLIVIGPGSLYTSLLPIVLVRDIADAIARSRARVVLVMNLMTEAGETDRYSAADHLDVFTAHTPHVKIHDVLFNTAPVPPALVDEYARGGAVPIVMDAAAIDSRKSRAHGRPLLAAGAKIRHDHIELARALLELGPLSAGGPHV